MDTEELMQCLEQAIIDGDIDTARECAFKSLEMAIDPLLTINQGLIRGIKRVGDNFGNGEIFLPDLILSSEAMREASVILEDALKQNGKEFKSAVGTVVIGTVAGDIHDIGKTLVATLFKAAGFAVIDLGVDVPRTAFVEAVKRHRPDILGLSSLLTTSADEQRQIIAALAAAGIRDSVKVMVGGGAISEQWSREIGADAYGGDAREAVEKGKQLLTAYEGNRNGDKEHAPST